MIEIGIGGIADAPEGAAVFLLWPRAGEPYLARTSLLRRRLTRLLGERDQSSRLLHLRGVVERIEYWPTASKLGESLLFYQLARRHFPDRYTKLIKLRSPAWIKLTLSNPFPRTAVTTRIQGGSALYYGPFRTRAAAELFDSQALDLFQIRRCQENLDPSPDHPGCIYGEMNMCLRPCQQVVGPEEYRSEVTHAVQFFETDGASLVESATAARERASEDFEFEEAARQHKRLQRIEQVLALRDGLVRDARRLHGAAVLPSLAPDSIELRFFRSGCWLEAVELSLAVGTEGKSISLDRRLRDLCGSLPEPTLAWSEREEHIALLTRWHYSSKHDDPRHGEWIAFDDWAKIPYRKVVNAVSRVARGIRPNVEET